MFEVIRCRRRGEWFYQHFIVPYGSEFSKGKETGESSNIYRFGPFTTEEEAREFIEEVESEH